MVMTYGVDRGQCIIAEMTRNLDPNTLTVISSIAALVSSACHLPCSVPGVWLPISRISSESFFPTCKASYYQIYKPLTYKILYIMFTSKLANCSKRFNIKQIPTGQCLAERHNKHHPADKINDYQ